MKAIIMAGGEGSRLRPLTCDCPKPMMRMMDRPVMEYALRLVKKHGIDEVAVTLGYLPERVSDYFGDGEQLGLQIRYYTEENPLGTAGGVKQAADFLDETFLVLSGDGLTDLDISAAAKAHRQSGALVTLVLKRVKNPLEYGVVVTGSEGRVVSFQEKPGWGEVISDAVNTGIYIMEPEVLDRIPAGVPFDFGAQLFPKLVERGERIYGYITDAYWCDIGDVGAYMKAHRDALDGKINLEGICPRPGRESIMPGARVEPGAIIEAPCYIASGARVESGAVIGAYSVLGEGTEVKAGASVKRVVMWPGSRVMERAQARCCVLANRAVMEPGSTAYEECALGTGATLGRRASLKPGVKLWPGRRVDDFESLDANLVWGGITRRGFAGSRLMLPSPADAAEAGRAFAAALKPGDVLLGRNTSAVAQALWHSMASGLMAQGVQVLDAGQCTLPELRFLQEWMDCPAMLIEDGYALALAPSGAPLDAKLRRKISGCLNSQDYSGPFTGITRPVVDFSGSNHKYVAWLSQAFDADVRNAPPVAIYSQQPRLLELAEMAFLKAGINVRAEWDEHRMELGPGEIGVWFSDDGEDCIFSDENGALDECETELMRAWTLLEGGDTVLIAPPRYTRGLAELADRYGAAVESRGNDIIRWEAAMAEEYREQFNVNLDGIYFALKALSRLANADITLAEWRLNMPHRYRRRMEIDVPLDRRGGVLSGFVGGEHVGNLDCGVEIDRNGALAWVCPDEEQPRIKVVAEASSMEAASELCDFVGSEIDRLLKAPKDGTGETKTGAAKG